MKTALEFALIAALAFGAGVLFVEAVVDTATPQTIEDMGGGRTYDPWTMPPPRKPQP